MKPKLSHATCFFALLLANVALAGRHHAIFIALERDPGSLVADNTAAGKVWLLKNSLVTNFGFASSDIQTFSADSAPKAALEKALAGLSDRTAFAPGDDLLIYYIGSRAEINGEMVLQTSDTRVAALGGSDTSDLAKTGLSIRDIAEAVRKCACGSVILMTDGPFAGATAPFSDADEKDWKSLSGDREWLGTQPLGDDATAFSDAFFGLLQQNKEFAVSDIPGLAPKAGAQLLNPGGYRFLPVAKAGK